MEKAEFKIPEKCEGCLEQEKIAEKIAEVEQALKEVRPFLEYYISNDTAELKEDINAKHPPGTADALVDHFKDAFSLYVERLEGRLELLKQQSAKYAESCIGMKSIRAEGVDEEIPSIPVCSSEYAFILPEYTPDSPAKTVILPFKPEDR